MILPVKTLIDTLTTLELPVYISEKGHKCHFKDVIVVLSKISLIKEGLIEEDDIVEDEMLTTEWQS